MKFGSPAPATLTASELVAADLPLRQPILEPILARKSLAMLYGPPGVGKTFVALGIAWAAASGGTFLKWRATTPHQVLYIDGEMAALDIRQRLQLMGPPPPTLDLLIADLDARAVPDFADPAAPARLWGALRRRTRPALMVLDNLASLVGFRRNEPDSWSRIQHWLLAMRRSGTAVLVVHHASKKGGQRGSNRREDVLDLVMAMRRPPDYQPCQGARFELQFEKARGLFGEDADPIEARLVQDGDGVRWDWQPAHRGDVERVVALLKTGLDARHAARELGFSVAKAYRLRKRAIEAGFLSVTATARDGRTFRTSG
jgi:AAA domain-containing protein